MADSVLDGLVRIGTVTDTNEDNRQVRVKFENVDMTSGWLPVLQHYGAEVIAEESDVEEIDDDGDDGGEAPTYTLGYWMPNVNDIVLVLYLPVWNADGFVLGAI